MSPCFDALRGHAAVGSDDPYPDCNPTPQKHVPGPFVTKFPAAKCCPSSPGRNVTPANSPSKFSAHHAPSSYHGGKVTPAKLPSTIMVNYISPGVKRSSPGAGVSTFPAKYPSKMMAKVLLLVLV